MNERWAEDESGYTAASGAGAIVVVPVRADLSSLLPRAGRRADASPRRHSIHASVCCRGDEVAGDTKHVVERLHDVLGVDRRRRNTAPGLLLIIRERRHY